VSRLLHATNLSRVCQSDIKAPDSTPTLSTTSFMPPPAASPCEQQHTTITCLGQGKGHAWDGCGHIEDLLLDW
jgi:hypothetical protein